MPKIDKKCANLAREIWRTIGRCENCGKTKAQAQLQGAHIIGVGTARRIQADLRNGLCLCSYCHRYFTDHPHEFVVFIDGTECAQYVATLRTLARPGQGQKIDWQEKLEFLKDIKKQIEAGEITLAEAREYE